VQSAPRALSWSCDDPDAAQVLVDTFAGAPGILTDVYSMLAPEPSSTVVPEDLVLMLEGECEDPAAVVGSLGALGVVRATDGGRSAPVRRGPSLDGRNRWCPRKGLAAIRPGHASAGN
jgi:hypothetical protein